MYISEEYFEENPINEFTDFDDLLYQWRQYVNTELTEFKVIKSDLYGTGCVCDLKTMFESNDTSPEFVMKLMPRVSDCASECLYMKYTELIGNFLGKFVNASGSPMTITDLGQNEQFFYNDFEKVAKQKIIFNTWDLWRIDGLTNTK